MRRRRTFLLVSILLMVSVPTLTLWAGVLRFGPVHAPRALAAGGPSLLPAGGQFVGVPIVRVLDTRYGTGGVAVQPIPAGGTVTFPAAGVFSIPSNADSVVLDINAINPAASGFLSVYDADASDPALAAVGLRAGEGTNQEATVQVGDSGSVSLTNHSAGTVDVAASVPGYYTGDSTASAGDTYVGLPWASPVLNTSTGWNVPQAPIPAGGSLTFQVTGVGGVGSGADTAVLQVNALKATAVGYLTAYAAGASDPGVSALAYFSDDTYRNLVYVPLSPSGQATLANHGSAPVDVSVYARGAYLPPPATPAGAVFVALGPQLVYGTATAGTQLASGASATFQVSGTGDIPATEVAGVSEDVVVSNPTAMGRLDEGPAGGALQPVVSFLNADSAYTGYDNGLVSTLSPSGQQTITNESAGTVSVQVAVTGWFQAPVAPGEPMQVAATISGSSASVTWAAPVHDGGSPVTGYTITAPPDTAAAQVGPGTYQATLSGLTQAATDTFTVTATNAVGPGIAGTMESDTCVPMASLSVGDAAAAQAETYWTDALAASSSGYSGAAIDAAVQANQIPPVSPIPATGDCPSLTMTTGSATAVGDVAPLDPAASHPITGYPTVGKFFMNWCLGLTWPSSCNQNCTGTVINGGNGIALVLTAAHCIEAVRDIPTKGNTIFISGNWMFAPEWHDNKFPYGKWGVVTPWVDSRWITKDANGNWQENGKFDYAVIQLKRHPDRNGVLRGVGYFTGEDDWSYSMPPTKNVRILGIPHTASSPLQVITESTVDDEPCGYQIRTAKTPGFGDGASGGPWFYSFNTTTKLGTLLGDTGGCQEGGATDSPSFSPYWRYDFYLFVTKAASKV